MKLLFFSFLTMLTFISCQSIKQEKLLAYSPIPIKRVIPDNPDSFIRLDVEAITQLSALVDENGNVTEVKVIHSDLELCDTLSINAMYKWKYKPGGIVDEQGNYRISKFWVPIFFDWNSNRTVLVY